MGRLDRRADLLSLDQVAVLVLLGMRHAGPNPLISRYSLSRKSSGTHAKPPQEELELRTGDYSRKSN